MLSASRKKLSVSALWVAWLLLAATCWGEPTLSDALGSCLAVVKYSAITGDPGKANKSDIFRGFVRVEDQVDSWNPRESELSWTFTQGETIMGGDNVFRDSVEGGAEVVEVQFSSATTANTQSVTIEYFAEDEVVDIGFVATKGVTSGTGGGLETRTAAGLPDTLEYNGLTCESDDQMGHQFLSTKDDAEVIKGNSVVKLEYLPIEFANMRFGTGYASNFAIFTFRLTNNGTTKIDLADLELEYWFDGGSAQGKTSDLMFNSECMTSTVADCSLFKVSVQPGLENVSGAHYKVVVRFAKDAGSLVPKKPISLPIDGLDQEEKGPTLIEAILNITSAQFFSQIDVTKDYSFLNTSIVDEDHNLPDPLISREYELNPKIPIFLNNQLVFGSRPKSSQQKATLLAHSNQNQCWFKNQNIQQCGMRARYCCSKRIAKPEEESKWNPLQWVLIVVLVVAGALLSILCVYFSFRRNFNRNFSGHKRSLALTRGKFGSDAESILDGDMLQKPSDMPYDEFEESIAHRSSTKYHTVPSIVGINALLLDPSVMEWDKREQNTWTGHVHWCWEPWNEAEVRRASTALPIQNSGPGSFLTMTTRYLTNIDVHVDYKAEIEPFLEHQLGEGGFGKVYKGTFRGLDVAVKVLKVDTDAMIKNLEDEIKLSSKMHNEHIVKLLGACLGNKDNVCLIMELVDGGNLSTRIHNKNQRRLEYIEVLNIGLDIVRGLAYLHPTVIHRDLKPQNVLLSKDGRCKIADFGISKFKDPHKSYLSVTQTGGTPNYMAPELFNGTRVDEKCDIFSLGCILYEAMARRVPLSDLQGDNCAPLFQIIKTVAIDKRRPKIPEAFPSDLAELIRACWKDNPRSRPSSTDVTKQLVRMIDDEVKRMKELRESAQRKESGASANGSDRRSPVLDFFGGRFSRHEHHLPPDGRRMSDTKEDSSMRPRPKPKVPARSEPKHPVAAQQRSAVELETYHSAKSIEFFTGEDNGRLAARGSGYQLERYATEIWSGECAVSFHSDCSCGLCSALSNPDSICNELHEPMCTGSPSSSSTITPRSTGSKESRKAKSKEKLRGVRDMPQHTPDLSAVVEEFEPPARSISSDRMSMGSNGLNSAYGQYEQEENCRIKPVPRKTSSSRFNDISKLELDDSFLMGLQRKVNTQS